jgi:hypothetical protein
MMYKATRGPAPGIAWLGAVLGAALLIGCGGGDDDPQPMRCPIGDVSAPAEMQIVHLDENNAVVQTEAMQSVPLIAPPQGGWIVLLGVRAKNLDGCQAVLTTALVDACDEQIIQIDRRPTRLEMDADGWGVSTVTSFGNLPVCPQLTAARDLERVPYIVRVSIEDADGQKAAGSITVVPTCLDSGSRCACECNLDYVVGAECPAVPTPHTTCDAAVR